MLYHCEFGDWVKSQPNTSMHQTVLTLNRNGIRRKPELSREHGSYLLRTYLRWKNVDRAHLSCSYVFTSELELFAQFMSNSVGKECVYSGIYGVVWQLSLQSADFCFYPLTYASTFDTCMNNGATKTHKFMHFQPFFKSNSPHKKWPNKVIAVSDKMRFIQKIIRISRAIQTTQNYLHRKWLHWTAVDRWSLWNYVSGAWSRMTGHHKPSTMCH